MVYGLLDFSILPLRARWGTGRGCAGLPAGCWASPLPALVILSMRIDVGC